MLPRGLLKEYSQTLSMLLRMLDVLAIIMAGWFAYVYKFKHFYLSSHYMLALLIAVIFTLVIFSFYRIYDSMRGQRFFTHLSRIIQALCIIFLFLAGLAFLTKSG